MKNALKRSVAFALLFAAVFVLCCRVLGNDDGYAATMFDKFYALPVNAADAVWIGGSNVQDFSVAPVMYKETGISLFSVTASGIPFSATEFMIREVEKTQDPKVYLVDVRRLLGSGIFAEADIRRFTDNMRPSLNWAAMTGYMLDGWLPDTEDRLSYYLPLIRYHSRWNQLRKEDFTATNNSYFGYHMRINITPFEYGNIKERFNAAPQKIPELYEKYLLDFLDFCDSFDKPIIFTATPFCWDEACFGNLNYIKGILTQRGYPIWDLSLEVEAIGLDYGCDFSDSGHTNVWGAQKISRYVAQQLAKRYDLPDHRGDPRYQAWADELAHFEEDLAEAELRLTTDWDEYLDRLLLLDPEQYTIFMTVRGSQGEDLDRSAVEKLETLGFDMAETLLDGQDHAFVAIRAGGGYRYQDISDGEGALSYNEMLHNQQVSLTSRTVGAGNSASIRLGTREYGKNRSGFNIVVEDVLDGELVDSVSFDLDAETVTASR